MKRIVILCMAIFAMCAVQAQELPYSKYLNFSKADFKENKFKYHKKLNKWTLSKTDGLNVALNVLSVITLSDEELRPSVDDYTIMVQMGEDDMVAYVVVEFYNDDAYHKILSFMMDNGDKLQETSSGKLIRHTASYNDLVLELDMFQNFISRTTSYSAGYHTSTNVDESYNEYTYTITTNVKPTSRYLEKQAAKKAKREAKGKKKDLEDMM